MGLPSGILWRRCNIGADVPEGLGYYFSWGNVEGHAVDSGYNFSQGAYSASPAASIDADLSLSQDAARVILGAPWRMPSYAEFRELIDNCTTVWYELNGVRGLLFTSNLNGNTLFLPAGGFFNGSLLEGRNTSGYYWSSTYISEALADKVTFDGSGILPYASGGRQLGYNVRAVMDPT